MTETSIDYCDLARRAVAQPLLALYACCPNCGGDIGVHEGFARLLDGLYGTGVKFCEFHGQNCLNDHDAREWVWTRYRALERVSTPSINIEIEFDVEPVYFEIAA